MGFGSLSELVSDGAWKWQEGRKHHVNRKEGKKGKRVGTAK